MNLNPKLRAITKEPRLLFFGTACSSDSLAETELERKTALDIPTAQTNVGSGE